MKRFVFCLLFVAGTMLGCAQNHFNIPAENFAEKVKVLGVAPLLIDTDSDINYPQKDLLLALISDLNRKYEPLLIRKLQSTGNFYAVTLQADEPRQLFTSLVARHEKRDDANTQYNKYFFKNDGIGAYIKNNRLDAVMVIIVNGLTKASKIYSSNLLTSLESDFNFLTVSAQILGPDGTVLWEYPNFRGRLLPYYPLVNLQYPNFSESEANQTSKTEVHFKTLDGIRRTLEQKKSDLLLRETQEPEIYGRVFDEMTALIKHSVDRQIKSGATDAKPLPPVNETLKPTAAPETAAPAAADPAPPQPAETPVQVPSPANSVETPETPATAPNEIVPAL